jgi:hypothetical protein
MMRQHISSRLEMLELAMQYAISSSRGRMSCQSIFAAKPLGITGTKVVLLQFLPPPSAPIFIVKANNPYQVVIASYTQDDLHSTSS